MEEKMFAHARYRAKANILGDDKFPGLSSLFSSCPTHKLETNLGTK